MFQYRVNKAKAQELLARAGTNIAQLKRDGEVELETGLKLTLSGRCTYNVVDLFSDTGETLADLVSEEHRNLIPAWDKDDQDRTRPQRLADEKDAADLQRVRLALLKG